MSAQLEQENAGDNGLDQEAIDEILGMQDRVRELGDEVSELKQHKPNSRGTAVGPIDSKALKDLEDRILAQVEEFNAHQEEQLR